MEHFRIQTALKADAERRRLILAIQPVVGSECLHVDSCADADGIRLIVRNHRAEMTTGGQEALASTDGALLVRPEALAQNSLQHLPGAAFGQFSL